MKTMTTCDPVVRYVAFDNPATLVIHENTESKGRGHKNGTCNEIAVYDLPVKNRFHPHLIDGIYGEIHAMHDGRYGASCGFYSPTRKRFQIIKQRMFPEWGPALIWLEARVRIARRLLFWVNMAPPDDGPMISTAAPDWVLETMKRIEKDYPLDLEEEN